MGHSAILGGTLQLFQLALINGQMLHCGIRIVGLLENPRRV